MNTQELQQYMLRDEYIRQFYGGVIAIDQLPLFVCKPKVFIVNSDPISLPGTHWYAIYMDKINEHFDSAGFKPSETMEVYLIAKGPKYRYNSKRVQAFYSKSCGLFCLFYCYFRCRGFTFSQIMNMFSDNLKLNEILVQHFYELTT